MSCSANLGRWAAIVIVLAVWGNDGQAATIRTVAITDDAAPGAPGAVFQSLTTPTLNNLGQTVFEGYLLREGTVDASNDNGVWSEGDGVLHLVARTGGHLPGFFPGQMAEDFRIGGLNDAGRTAFGGSFVVGPGGVTEDTDYGIWVERAGAHRLVAREGRPAPDVPAGAIFQRLVSPILLNSSSQVLFHGTLVIGSGGVEDGNARGLWSDGGGPLHVVARRGDGAPGNSVPQGTWDFFDSASLNLNSAGQVAFGGTRKQVTGGVSHFNDEALWSEGGGQLHEVAREGSSPLGTTLVLDSAPPRTLVMNSLGQTAFGSGIQSTSSGNPLQAIWKEEGGQVELVVITGSLAPGAPNGEPFRLFDGPALNSSGEVAFRATLGTGGSSPIEGVWSNVGGTLDAVAFGGMQAPGTSEGVIFETFTDVGFNALGQTAFSADLDTSVDGVTSANNKGIWAQKINGDLVLIAREGDLLEVAPGDFRQILGVGYSGSRGNDNGRASAFNNLGQLAFYASFTDGSNGIFVSNAAAIPEPATFALVGIGLALLFSCRRRAGRE